MSGMPSATRPRRFASLSSQLTLISLIIFVLFCLGCALVNNAIFKNDIEARAKDRVTLLAQTINFAFETMIDRHDLSALQHVVENVATDPAVRRLSIVDRNLTILADKSMTGDRAAEQQRIHTSEKELITRALQGVRQIVEEQDADGTSLVTVAMPLRGGRYFPEFHSDIVGVIRLSYDLSPFHAAAQRTTIITIISQCITFLAVILVLSLVARRVVLQPIRRLAQASRQLALGSLTIRVDNTSRTEVGELGAAFNDMAGRIEILVSLREQAAASIARSVVLEDANATLQAEVAERKQIEQKLLQIQSELQVQQMAALNLAEDAEEGRQRAEQMELEVRQLNEDLEQRVLDRVADLQAANKELEAFAYSVSHDLRSPLRAIDGFSRILLVDFAAQLPEACQRYLSLTRQSTQRMGQMIDDLLGFSRLGRKQIQKQSVSPAELVRTVLAELRDQQNGKHIEVVLGDLPSCRAEPALLKQVYANLLSNAFKFTRSQPAARIEIGCRHGTPTSSPIPAGFVTDEPGVPVYFVKDNGAGFDMQYSHKLFGVFQRLHRTEDFEGTGVGLAIVQRIVQSHGGRVWAEAAVNQGATFYFTLV